MKQQLISALVGIAVMILPACNKVHDQEKFYQQELKLCPILKMQSLDPGNLGSAPTQININYNAAGNPVDMLDILGAFGNQQDYHFRYDRFNRLTDYIMNPTSYTISFEWHTYSYPSKNIVVDSIYGENDGALITAAAPNTDSYLGYKIHTLDQEGRIIMDQEFLNGFQNTNHFQYDARGDMIKDGVVYDNKINPYQTNGVWKFIYEDYSVNNPLNNGILGAPVTITEYNSFGLPQIIQGNSGISLFRYSFYPEMQIVYGCDAMQIGPEK